MKKINSTMLLLLGGISLVSLTGCDQMEQAATDVVEKARQSAVQVLDEAAQTGSITQAMETANQAVVEAKEQAAGLLGQASEYLSKDHKEQAIESLPAGESLAPVDLP